MTAIRSVLFIASLIAAVTATAQKYAADYGKLTDAEVNDALAIKNYPSDTSAGALILYKKLEVTIVPAGTKVSYIIRTRILKSSSVKTWADYELLPSKQGFTTVKGVVYNLENKTVTKSEVLPENVNKTKYNRNFDMYMISMRNVRVGSLIEYTYSTVYDFWTLPDFKFQSEDPTLCAEYYLTPSELGFHFEEVGDLKVQYETLKAKKVHHWRLNNIPAFKKEPLMPHEDLFLSAVRIIDVSRSWQKEIEPLWNSKFFGRVILYQRALTDRTAIAVGQELDPKLKAKKIVEYLKVNIEWDGFSDFLAEDPDLVFKRRKGSSGDINLALVSMLTKAGIISNPVLLSTRANGKPYLDVPSIRQFDYVIAMAVMGKDTLLLDATDPSLKYDVLPIRCLNGAGLVASRENQIWMKIKPALKYKTSADATFALDPEGQLKGQLNVVRDGYEAFDQRAELKKQKDAYYKSVVEPEWEVISKKIENESTLDAPLKETYEVVISNHGTVAGDMIYVDPFVALRNDSNPFTVAERKFPIEYDVPIEETYLCKITIPDGYKVEQLPESKMVTLSGNGGRLMFNYAVNGNQIQVLSRLQLNRTLFGQNEYPVLREFYSMLVAKKQEQIVLKKN